MLLPSSVMFLLTPGRENAFLGMLGIVFFVVMATASKVTHRASMSAIRLNRANQTLMVGMECERQTSERANAQLSTAQAALSESLKTLEVRIKSRTADLEHEIQERKRDGKELARLASRDSLTGLYNRSTLTDRLRSELLRAGSANAPIAVLFLDLDKFKEVNDLKGHFWGDEVLREVSRRLIGLVPANAMSARWGGDEFVFVLCGADAATAATAIGEQLRSSVRIPISIGAETVRIDATIGVALFPHHGRTADELIRAADMAMYAAKGGGRGRVRIFDPALAEALCVRLLLEHELHEAIAAGALRLEFQPIVAADDKRCHALEVLLRWNHPARGNVGPSEFIPLAERSGDIITIGRWALVNACAAAASWPGDPAPAVSVNVSVAHIMAGSLLDDVRAALASSGLEPRRLHLEVTESLFVSDHELIVPTLAALRAMGIRISLDDFGTGFSSLGNLRLLPIDTLKIDKSFVDRVDGESGPIIRAIRSLAHALDIELVAEGVETPHQAALLQSIGVHFLQGYHFSRPLPSREVAAWLIDASVGDNGSRIRLGGQLPAAAQLTASVAAGDAIAR
jgi:diguanylate cyclase (GGDEF)-like protein